MVGSAGIRRVEKTLKLPPGSSVDSDKTPGRMGSFTGGVACHRTPRGRTPGPKTPVKGGSPGPKPTFRTPSLCIYATGA